MISWIIIGFAGAPETLAKQTPRAAGSPDGQRTEEAMSLSGPLSASDRDEPIAPDARYRLRNGDVIEVNFPFVPAFNQTMAIQPDGYVTLHAIGAFHVAGLTVSELTETLRAGYATILRDPVMTVALKEFERPYFIVAGEVERPGKYELRGQTTVTQAVAIAGGLKEQAKQSEAVVFHRLSAGEFESRTLDLKEMMKKAQLAADVQLGPGDMLFVPRGRRVKIGELLPSLWILSLFY
jgi:polysaccharide export outer membrane protein